jgi:hypothetical protein
MRLGVFSIVAATSSSITTSLPSTPHHYMAPPPHRFRLGPQQIIRLRVRGLIITIFLQAHLSYICRSCVDVLEELLPCCALEQVCIYNNVLDKLELFTALLARGYPQPAAQRVQADMNVLPLIR